MIKIAEAIENGSCYFVTYQDDFDDEMFFSFQIKINDFHQLDFNDVDDVEEIENIEIGSNIWILKFDLVNLNKKKYDDIDFGNKLVVCDQDGYQYNTVCDSHLCQFSDFAKTSGLDKFLGMNLPPKIPKSGAYVFELPEYIEELYLDMEGGEIGEV